MALLEVAEEEALVLVGVLGLVAGGLELVVAVLADVDEATAARVAGAAGDADVALVDVPAAVAAVAGEAAAVLSEEGVEGRLDVRADLVLVDDADLLVRRPPAFPPRGG